MSSEIKVSALQPLFDRVVVEREGGAEKVGSIIIPDAAKKETCTGKVVSVGPGTDDVKMVVHPGQRVLFAKYAGSEIELNGHKCLVLGQEEILCTIPE